ncbi:DUF1501 domain-containing protein [Tundrisphaera lichenicola]|uniref:DUF1501 domain-containing protein n=1 Tax=Tundrisphaera lichenicola TaxID=2029860 RepID=UPI003EBCE5C9
MLRPFDDFPRIQEGSSIESGYSFRVEVLRLSNNPRISSTLELTCEDPRLRDRYGRHLWGHSCLLARRLAEEGSSVISIDALAPSISERYFSWDDHINVQTRWDLGDAMKHRAPFMDQALSALVEDVYARGPDRKIIIVTVGEFGRTPRLTRADGLFGRDHWPSAQSALIRRGGLKMGQVIGSTNRRGEYPSDLPLTPKVLLATIYRHLGTDDRAEFLDTTGRPAAILSEGEPIRELL